MHYCLFIEFTWRSKNVVVRGSQCKFEENNPNPEKNFAMERYGTVNGRHSKCFEHTNKMWEERSCFQTREWQHFGSGCYLYSCKNGRVHIHVGNYTFECYRAGQEIDIRIFEGGWLKMGAIVCPHCNEICGDEFLSKGEECRPPEEVPSHYFSPKDSLKCNSAAILPSVSVFALSFIFIRLQN